MDKRAALKRAIEAETDTLRRILRGYVVRLGASVPGAAAASAAEETLNEVVLRALNAADRYQPGRQLRPWLLGIALNVIREGRTAKARREIPVHDLYPESANLSEDELFERLEQVENPFALLESDQRAAALLAFAPAEDRRIIELAVLYELDSTALARELKITPGAARVRLHRALGRLRAELAEKEKSDA